MRRPSEWVRAGVSLVGMAVVLVGTPLALIVWVGILAMALMGFLDDFLKVRRRHNRGVFWKHKNYVTLLMSFGIAWWLVYATGISETIALTRAEISVVARTAVRDGAAAALGGIVALIGLAMLCVAAVDALGPVIAPLWARLLLMAAVYLAVGGGVALLFVRKLREDVASGLEQTRTETEKTSEAVEEALNA